MLVCDPNGVVGTSARRRGLGARCAESPPAPAGGRRPGDSGPARCRGASVGSAAPGRRLAGAGPAQCRGASPAATSPGRRQGANPASERLWSRIHLIDVRKTKINEDPPAYRPGAATYGRYDR
jgi:hypothetical protein